MSWCSPRSSKPVRGTQVPWAGSIPVRFRESPMMNQQDERRSPQEGDITELRALPAVSTVLMRPLVAVAIRSHGLAAVTRAVREVIDEARIELAENGVTRVPDEEIAER